MFAHGDRRDLHQALGRGRADRAGLEVRFLQRMRIGERRIDFASRSPASTWARDRLGGRIGLAAARGVVRHVELGRGQAEAAGEARERLVIAGIADLAPGRAALRWRACRARSRPARSRRGRFRLSCSRSQSLRVEIRLREAVGQLHAELFGGEHAVERLVELRRLLQMLAALVGQAAAGRGAARPVMRGGGQFGIGAAVTGRVRTRRARPCNRRVRHAARPATQSPSATHGPVPSCTCWARASASASRFSM